MNPDVKFGEKKNAVRVDGVRYKAKPLQGCTGCAFQTDHTRCNVVRNCATTRREDGRSIIWVKAKRQEKKAPV